MGNHTRTNQPVLSLPFLLLPSPTLTLCTQGETHMAHVHRRMKNKGPVRVQTKNQVEEAVRLETPV